MYAEPDYADSRLNGTIVRIGNKPVYVKRVNGDMTCDVLYNVNRDDEVEVVHLDELNPLSPPLGYTNYRGRAYYLSRSPMRRDYRQGLRNGQVKVLVGGAGSQNLPMLMSCVEGKFPNLQRAKELVKDGVKSIALSRDLCLHYSGGRYAVMYKWSKVGMYKGGKLILNDKYRYLQPLVEELK